MSNAANIWPQNVPLKFKHSVTCLDQDRACSQESLLMFKLTFSIFLHFIFHCYNEKVVTANTISIFDTCQVIFHLVIDLDVMSLDEQS